MPEEGSGPRQFFVDWDPLRGNPAIDLVRDPSLLPSARDQEIEAFWQTIERYRKRLHKLGVLNGVDAQHQKELAALVLDLDERYQDWAKHKQYNARLKVRMKRGPGHIRKLAQKLSRARSLLRALQADAAKVDQEFADAVVLHVSAALDDLARIRLAPGTQTIQEFTKRLTKFRSEWQMQRLQPDDPRRTTAIQIFDQLHASDVSKLDAYVRTAKIGNALWQWTYAISTNASGAEECPGVGMLVRRMRPKSTKRLVSGADRRSRQAALESRNGSKKGR